MRDERLDLGEWLFTLLLVLPAALITASPFLTYIASRDAGASRIVGGCIGVSTLLAVILSGLLGFWTMPAVSAGCSFAALAVIWRACHGENEEKIEELDSPVSFRDLS